MSPEHLQVARCLVLISRTFPFPKLWLFPPQTTMYLVYFPLVPALHDSTAPKHRVLNALLS